MSNYRYVSQGMLGKPLATGTDKKGKTYNRVVSFQPGYDDLVNIVAGLQKDVKRINQCITLDGAQAFVNAVDKNGNPIRKNWEAVEDDITGPNGKPDGIKEVFVTDAKGNVKIINGYTLGKSTYPVRKAYRTAFKTKEERKAHPFTQFKKDLYRYNGFDEESNPTYIINPVDIGAEFASIQPLPDPRKVYKDLLFKPVYDSKKDVINTKALEPMQKAQFFNKNLSDCYNRHVKDQVLASMLGRNPDEVPQKEVAKVMRSKEFRNICADRVTDLCKNQLSPAQSEIAGLLDDEIENLPEQH